jgi:hypothetical protein
MEFYTPCNMTSNNMEWERGWFYLHNDEPGLPPYTGKVVKDKMDSWHPGLSPSSHQAQLDSLLRGLKNLVDAGLAAASVLANLHHRRIIPLMERELRIYEMSDAANPVSLARSRLLNERLPTEYAATRARCAVSLKGGKYSNDDLWSFAMLLDAPAVSGLSPLLLFSRRVSAVLTTVLSSEGDRGRPAVRPAHALGPHGRARGAASGAGASGAQERERDPAAGAPGREGQGVPSAQAAGTFSPSDLRGLVISRRRGGRGQRGAGPPRELGACNPLTKSRGGGRGASVWGGRGSARHQAVYGRGGTRHGGTGVHRGGVWDWCAGGHECRSDIVGCRDGGDRHRSDVWERRDGSNGCHSRARRTLEEVEARLLHLEVGSRSPECFGFERLGTNSSVLRARRAAPTTPPRAR